MTCETCEKLAAELQCIDVEENGSKHSDVTCDWCSFKANQEPVNQKEGGWKIKGVKIPDGTFFVFEALGGSMHAVHVSCFRFLANEKRRTELLQHTKRWWLFTEKAGREFPNVMSFRAHFDKLFAPETPAAEPSPS
jgi:hypothetical protein